MILEGIVTTRNRDASVNVSPMGPEVDASFSRLVLKPYQTSRTFQNLQLHHEGVFHVVDDVELLARAAIDRFDEQPRMLGGEGIGDLILAETCRWYTFRVHFLDDSQERTRIECEVLESGRLRDFFGFNRAKHAVVEAAILATRTSLLPATEIRQQLSQLRVLVDKTGGQQEHRAFDLLWNYVEQTLTRA